VSANPLILRVNGFILGNLPKLGFCGAAFQAAGRIASGLFFLANRKSASGIDLSQKRNEGGGSAEGSRRPFGLTQNYFILGKLPGRGCEGVVVAARLFRGPPLWAEAREPTPLNLKYEPRRDLYVTRRPGSVRLPESQVGLLA
jgi:hypothetical protein